MISPHPLACTIALLLLGACASGSDKYPSLAIRDAERVSGSFDVDPVTPPPPAPAPPSAELLARLGTLQADAEAAHRAFMSAAPGAERLARLAAGSSVGSDRWASAQVALADLDSARSQAAIALGELDMLHIDSTLALEREDAIERTRGQVLALLAEEDAILERLRAMVGG